MAGALGDTVRRGAPTYDELTKALLVLDYDHHEIHEGNMYVASYLLPHGSELANDATLKFAIETGAKDVHLVFEIAVGGDADYIAYEDCTYTGGTSMTISSANRNGTDANTTVTAKYGVTTTNGTKIHEGFIPGGSGPTSGGGAGRGETEWILAPNTKYRLDVTNRSGSSYMLSVHLHWYEKA